MKKYCIDCKKELQHSTTNRCQTCYVRYKQQRANHCIDCGKIIRPSTKRCWVCYSKTKHKSNYCIDCGIKLAHNKSQRCRKCFSKTLEKPHYCEVCGKKIYSYYAKKCLNCYKKTRIRKKAYCIKCGKVLSLSTCKRCRSCFMKYKIQLQKGSKLSEKHKQNIGLASKKLWQNKEFRKKTIKATFKALNLHPNKPEILLNRLLKSLFKTDYKFVGDGQVILEGFNPDFINVNGQKKIIEMYSDYWHNLPSYKKRDKRRLKAYNKLGYKTLIIWENEFENLDFVAGKLIAFHEE